jgi:TATA-box binding protein (TBP) (component of TFIID and TFIIIB)
MKRTLPLEPRVAGAGPESDGEEDGDEPPAKKARRQRISKKFQFLPLDRELCKRFIVDSAVNKLAERLGSQGILAALVRGEHVQKHEIGITKDLKMTVHNIVFTCELYQLDQPNRSRSRTGPAPDDSYDMEEISLDLEEAPVQRGGEDEPGVFHARQAVEATVQTKTPLVTLGEAYGGREPPAPQKEEKEKAFYDIPLRRLIYYMRGYGTQLNTKRFTAVVLRNDALSAASLIFSSKMVSTGCARFELAIELMRDALNKIRSVGYDEFQDPVPCLRNIVSNGQFPRPICTNMMTLKYAEYCRRVALFPGVMFFHPEMDTRVILVFESGQICHSGAETIEQIHHDVSLVYPMLLDCIKTRRTAKIDAQCARILNLDRANPEFSRAKEAVLTGPAVVAPTASAETRPLQ